VANRNEVGIGPVLLFQRPAALIVLCVLSFWIVFRSREECLS